MARKKRKSFTANRKKKSKISSRKKSRTAARKRKTRKSRKSRPKGFGATISNAYRTVVGTIKDTDRLRNKLEPPATSETE